MVNIKQKALEALRKVRPRVTFFESGTVTNVRAGPYLVGIDLAADMEDVTVHGLYLAVRGRTRHVVMLDEANFRLDTWEDRH